MEKKRPSTPKKHTNKVEPMKTTIRDILEAKKQEQNNTIKKS